MGHQWGLDGPLCWDDGGAQECCDELSRAGRVEEHSMMEGHASGDNFNGERSLRGYGLGVGGCWGRSGSPLGFARVSGELKPAC